VAGCEGATVADRSILSQRIVGEWWPTLERLGITLLVTREYEHLVLAFSPGVSGDRHRSSYMRLPHPSGLVVDRLRQQVYVASTRNPSQLYRLAPAICVDSGKLDASASWAEVRPLLPVSSTYLPGSLYIHDLALLKGHLHANAVGQNAVIRLDAEAGHKRVWWPRCIESAEGPVFARNHIQLNSIAAGPSLEACYFTASSETISRRRPSHRSYPVDGRGVIFSGKTREPICRGLTRPHSARLHNDQLWVANSGYGELGPVSDGRFEPLLRLPGWTRGLCVHDDVVFVGSSRVIPRFRQYAPGLSTESSICAIHAIEASSGRILGSVVWPSGNQVFAIDSIPRAVTRGFPTECGGPRSPARERVLYFMFSGGGDS
jgi:uncharacterized protein (TIGR03032 family)